MGRYVGVVLAVLLALGATPAGAATKPTKTALIYGDSLVWESRWETTAAFAAKPTFTRVDRSYPATAPCDWLPELTADLATYKPMSVTIATAGNTNFSCMAGIPLGSPAYFAEYRSDLDAMFAAATNAGARVVFVDDPPMLDAARDAALVQIIAIATELAGDYHGVSIVKSARTQLSKSGKFTSYKPCLKSETAAMGCTAGQIVVRTMNGDPYQIGLHLCPESLTFPNPCATYSSGEFRFGKVLASVMVHPPKPVLA